MGGSESTEEPPVTLRIRVQRSGLAFDIHQHRSQPVSLEWTGSWVREAAEPASFVHRHCQRLMFQGREIGPDQTLRSVVGNLEHVVLTMLVKDELFPERLGPFRTMTVPLEPDDFRLPVFSEDVRRNGFYWELMPRGILRKGLRSPAADLVGQASPTHPVALSDNEKQEASMPQEACEFAFAYPLANWGHVEEDVYSLDSWQSTEHGDPVGDMATLKSFLAVGGFMYFDSDGQVVHLTTLGQALDQQPGVQFEPPRRWRREWTKVLMEDGRFHRVNIKSIREAGARHFCWLRPGEELRRADGSKLEKQPEVPHGGFAYLFHQDPLSDDPYANALDRYFAVSMDLTSAVKYPRDEASAPVGLPPFRPFSFAADGEHYVPEAGSLSMDAHLPPWSARSEAPRAMSFQMAG